MINPVPVEARITDDVKVMKHLRQGELGVPLHVQFGCHEENMMLTVSTLTGYNPVELYFNPESWRAFQAAVAAHNPFSATP